MDKTTDDSNVIPMRSGDSNITGFEGALKLLMKHARKDTGGARRCAMFLMSLWNGDEFKADLQALMYTDDDIFDAMLLVFRTLYDRNQQLCSVVSEQEFKPIYDLWHEAFGKES